jgi:hypothetical protein
MTLEERGPDGMRDLAAGNTRGGGPLLDDSDDGVMILTALDLWRPASCSFSDERSEHGAESEQHNLSWRVDNEGKRRIKRLVSRGAKAANVAGP